MSTFLFLYKGYVTPTPDIDRDAALALARTNPMVTSVLVHELAKM